MPLQIIRQDITKMRVDAIVNSTNEEMIGYSGVDLAIHTVAGKDFDAECAKRAPLGLGEAKLTRGHHLPCKYVIHTAGPVWRGGSKGENLILRSCYLESLKLASKQKCRTVAFPLISSGVYGYPKDRVLKFAVQVISEFLLEHEMTVYICVFDKASYTFSQKLFCDIRTYIDDAYVDGHTDGYYLDNKEEKANAVLPTRGCRAAVPWEAIEEKKEYNIGLSLSECLEQMDKSFQEKLFDHIDRRGMTDVECYKKANVDKRTFSKIKSNKNYRPSKPTAVAFAISLQLSLEETQELLATLGMTLSKSNTFDIIIRYFVQNGNYDVFEINEALFEFDQVLLGAM